MIATSPIRSNTLPRKMIDPTTPIGNLSIQDGIKYYIQLGERTCNPELKKGMLQLLRTLTGRNPMHMNTRRPPSRYGSKSNRNFGYQNNFYRRDNRQNNNDRNFRGNMNRQPQNPNNDIYGENQN